MTVAGRRIGLACELLDRQLVDRAGDRCGKVDDLELLERPGGAGTFELHAALSGPGPLARRVDARALRWLVGLAGDRLVRVPWAHVVRIDHHVELAVDAHDIGLGQGEVRAAVLIHRAVGETRIAPPPPPRRDPDDAPLPEDAGAGRRVLRLSALLGRRVVDAAGTPVGCVRDVVVEKSGPVLGDVAGSSWIVVGVVLGRYGLAARLRGSLRPSDRVLPVTTWRTDDAEALVVDDT